MAARHFPDARISFDPFHVVALASKALDQVRRVEVRHQPDLKGSRWALLKDAGAWNREQIDLMHWLQRSTLKTARAWRLKEALRRIFQRTAKGTEAIKSVARATGYRIKENSGGMTWTEFPEQSGTSWSPPSAKENGFYNYHIQGCNQYGCGPWTAVAATVWVEIPTELPMTVPPGFRVQGGLRVNSWMKFTWGAVEGAVMYEIRHELSDCHTAAPTYHRIGAAAPQPYQQRATLGMCGGQELDPSTWTFAIRACADLDSERCWEWSGSLAVTTYGTATPLAVPTTSVYYHTDALGSPIAETDASGQVIKRMAYGPWGAPLRALRNRAPATPVTRSGW